MVTASVETAAIAIEPTLVSPPMASSVSSLSMTVVVGVYVVAEESTLD